MDDRPPGRGLHFGGSLRSDGPARPPGARCGSSGSGKTTLLRCLNFLEQPDRGRITVGGEVLFDADDPATQRESEVRKKRLHFGLFDTELRIEEDRMMNAIRWLLSQDVDVITDSVCARTAA